MSLGPCEPLSVIGDRNRLRQLLLNLTDNAVKYNEPGGQVTFALRRSEAHAELKIANTGCGVSDEMRLRVFDRFFRGDASHNNEVAGCGLGLSIAQWIVSTHGGTISMGSEANGRTTVTVHLPLTGS